MNMVTTNLAEDAVETFTAALISSAHNFLKSSGETTAISIKGKFTTKNEASPPYYLSSLPGLSFVIAVLFSNPDLLSSLGLRRMSGGRGFSEPYNMDGGGGNPNDATSTSRYNQDLNLASAKLGTISFPRMKPWAECKINKFRTKYSELTWISHCGREFDLNLRGDNFGQLVFVGVNVDS